MARLLYLANGPKRQNPAKLDERFAAWGLEVDMHWAYQGEFPETLETYDGVFLSGSPHGAYDNVGFIHQEHKLIEDVAARGIPMLGICFGSQILGSALCGRDEVFRRSTCEVGYKSLAMAPAAAGDTLAGNIGTTLRMFVWHNDEVRADHPDMTILAATEDCPNQIWRYRDAPIWGIQGHPEVDRAQAQVWFADVRPRLERDGADVDALIADAEDALEAKTMLRAFATYCLERSGETVTP